MTQIKDFTKGNIVKQISTFALPLLLSNLLQVLYNMVDMMVVGNVMGAKGLSAVSVGGDISNLLTFIAMGFANAADYAFLGLAGVNFLIEIAVNLLLAPMIVRLIKIGNK